MNKDESDVPELCTEPFASCLEPLLLSASNGSHPSTDLQEFMRKCYYGTATLTHLVTYDLVSWYITEEHPDYIWRQQLENGYPRPLKYNLRSHMTDRFWEIVIQYQAAREEVLKQKEEKRKLEAGGLPTSPIILPRKWSTG